MPSDLVARAVSCFDELDLGDPRRTRRARAIVERIARFPAASIPNAMGDVAMVEAAYRLANNRRVSFEDLLAPIVETTHQRALTARRVLVLHDTTDASFPHLDPEEIGYLQTGKAGFKIHLSLVLDDASWMRPLGIGYAETLHRAEHSRRGGRKKRAPASETAKWRDREYGRWWRGIQASAELLSECEEVIHVADRESDSYELMAQTGATAQNFVFRVRVDRRGREAGATETGWTTVNTIASNCEGILERTITLSSRKGKRAPGMNKVHGARDARVAHLSFAATTIEIPRPRYVSKDLPEVLELNLVHVVEQNPPEGSSPVEWMLYTNLPVETIAQVERVVDTYRSRWLIEEFNSALKSGTAYEARQFESRHALRTMLALSLPIATEILWIRSRARSNPTAPATEVLTDTQIRILRELGSYKLPRVPTARDALLAVAALGGHLKNNGEPGWKILSRAMTRLLAYEEAWDAAERALSRKQEM